MGLFSFLRKNKPDSASGDSEFYSHAEEDPNAPRRRKRKSGQNNEAVDPVLPEKKRARRRLVGAVALVLAAIIGLPMILDSEPKPLANDIAIQIPSKDNPLPASGKRDASSLSDIEVSTAASLDKNEEVFEPTSSAPSVEPTQNSDAKQPAPVTAKPEPQPEFRAVPKNMETPRDDSRARALLEGKTEARADIKPTSVNKTGKFVVQVAALATQEKVAELQGKLKSAGIKSYTQKVATSGGERIRVRIGPFTSKEEAERTREKLAKLGLNGSLVPA